MVPGDEIISMSKSKHYEYEEKTKVKCSWICVFQFVCCLLAAVFVMLDYCTNINHHFQDATTTSVSFYLSMLVFVLLVSVLYLLMLCPCQQYSWFIQIHQMIVLLGMKHFIKVEWSEKHLLVTAAYTVLVGCVCGDLLTGITKKNKDKKINKAAAVVTSLILGILMKYSRTLVTSR
uniref:uncharacterized protein LOC100184202 isoform X2 n=1 Tax=Ciona intestinalis TaxID=7719 RepID=UPI000EF53AC1|nr:uncharacterized protein LOC100184202 isoform X2 [Ciona intestinalis]|eukprot:XP_026692931.1 uncharacterized protein LOC100184202 isoform X2 [Ciona intestinalis]